MKKLALSLAVAVLVVVPIATASGAQHCDVCTLTLTVPNPKVWHVACSTTIAKGKYRVGYLGLLYADRINAQMDDPGRIYLSATLSTSSTKPTYDGLTVHYDSPGKVFAFEHEVTASKTITFNKATTLYLLVNAHDNDYDNDIEHLHFDGAITK